MAGDSGDNDSDVSRDIFEEIDNYHSSPSPSHLGISDEILAQCLEMEFSFDMIRRAAQETGANSNLHRILETLSKYSANSEASSSRSKMINDLKAMGFDNEELVLKAIQECGEGDDIDAITNTLLNYDEIERLREGENGANNDDDDDDDDDDDEEDLYSDEENESILKALTKMKYLRDESLIAIERCGQNASLADVIDFISAAQMARQFDEFYALPDEEEERIRRKRTFSEPSNRRRRPLNTSMNELFRLPNPMIGFGVPNEPGIMKQRPIPIPEVARGPPYFYYENVAMTPTGVWTKISSHLYGIIPEFVDSVYFCAAMRKRGYIHNLPIENRFQIQPPLPYTIQEALPDTAIWWPSWDKRKKLNCLLTCSRSAKAPGIINEKLKRYEGEPPQHEQKFVINQCKRWNLVWTGKNSVAQLEAHEMEELLGFPKNHTRGGGINRTDQYKSLGNSFQVDTVAYHLSVLKPLFPNGINVLSLFSGIGGGEVALHRLQIPMNVVVSVEISKANQNILSRFWVQTNQRGKLIKIADVQELDREKIEQLMDKYGGFDLVIGGSPCNNLAGRNRVTRNGLEGEQSSLFYDYCRILKAVRDKAARMRR